MSELAGYAHDALGPAVAYMGEALVNDPDYSFQVAAYHHGRLVLDMWAGPHLLEDSVMVPFSVTKTTIGVVAGLLVQNGALDLDAPVAAYWPEFAQSGKASVTVRWLLSHQAGIPQTEPPLRFEELFDDHAASVRLAASAPLWQPGRAFGYHALTIGNLASELIHRITGLTLQQFYEQEIRAVNDIDFFLGLPESERHRLVPVLPMVAPPVPPAPLWVPALHRVVNGAPGLELDRVANDPASWQFGHPAASGAGSARGIAKLLAVTTTGVDGGNPLLDTQTVATIGRQQVRGYDEVLGQAHRAHAVIFQKPTPAMDFGGPRAFGHDGAQGCFAAADPDSGLAFGYIVARGPWPGGADPRAIALMRALNEQLDAES